MEKKSTNKNMPVIIISVVVLALIGIIAFFFLGKEEGYRMIQVYEVNGEAIIQRPAIGDMDAYENLNLMSGDKVTTMLESYTRLKLDEDKYLLAEEDSIIELVATGDDKNSKTNINLLQGCVTIEIQNKLNEDSTFEVTTPNSVMAVRGTVFRVKVEMDEAGKPITKVSVFEGAVGVQKKDENGNLSKEKFVSSNKEAIVYSGEEKEAIVVLDGIDISDIPLEVLNLLREIIEGGTELSISTEAIKEAIQKINEQMSEDITETEENDTQEIEDDDKQESEADDVEDSKNDDTQKPENNDTEEVEKDDTEKPEEEDTQKPEEDTEEPEEEDTQKPEEDTEEPEEDTQEPEEDTEEPEEDDTQNPEEFTVTFTYKGEVFATQKVKEGEFATKPKLMPAPTGKWDFDFSTPITKDTEIQFVE